MQAFLQFSANRDSSTAFYHVGQFPFDLQQTSFLSSAVGWLLLQYRAVVIRRSLISCLMLLRRSEM